MLKKMDKKALSKIFLVTMILNLLLDMDQYLYPILDSLHLPLPSTILHLIWFPCFVLLVYFVLEKNKKQVFFTVLGIGIVYAGYFIIHSKNAQECFQYLFLPGNYSYSVVSEALYVLRLVLPFALIYATYTLNPEMKDYEKLAVILSMCISIPIVVTNLLCISPSTYDTCLNKTNFLHWFTDAYDTYLPREIASVFYYSHGNSVGIVQFMCFPFLWNVLYRAEKKWPMILGILVHEIAMFCLATRVATYGILIMTVAWVACWILNILMKKEQFDKTVIATVVMVLALFVTMLPYCPAVKNQQINTLDNNGIFENDNIRQEVKNGLGNAGKDLEEGTEEWRNFWSYIFVDNAWMLSQSKEYYLEYYNYKWDPEFWCDLIFDYDFFDRASGRDFQRIFFQTKQARLSPKQQFFGFGYSTFMNGSIVLEQDFTQQYYTLGVIGDVIYVLPWIFITLLVAVLGLLNFKEAATLDVLVMGLGVCGGLYCGYQSGHTLDEHFVNFLLAAFMGKLIRMVTTELKNNKIKLFRQKD